MKEPVKYGNTLSLDCATLMGWSVAKEGVLTEYGEIRLKRGEVDLWEFLTNISQKHGITRIVAESIFLDKNVKTFQRLANYHGVINLFSQLNDIELITDGYQPTQWKRVLTGDGYASKDKVKKYVNNLLNSQIESDNITDAIGILLAWAKRERNKQRL